VKTWRTKEGDQIPIDKLTDDHLRNILKMIERRYNEELDRAISEAAGLQGDIATYYADQAVTALASCRPEYTETYKELKAEAIKRGLLKL
jgi:hypothetical protein